jgi:hypothetical protein
MLRRSIFDRLARRVARFVGFRKRYRDLAQASR